MNQPQSKSQQDELTKLLINGWYLKDEKGPWQDGSMRVITPKPETIKAIQSYIDKAVKEARINEVKKTARELAEPKDKETWKDWSWRALDYLENRLKELKRGDTT